MKSVLLAGFEPFGGEVINPSAEIVRALHGRTMSGHEIVGTVLPCSFGLSIRQLKRQMKTSKPSLIIAIGQAGGRAQITPERVAINVDDARIPDNSARQPIDQPVVRGGPAAYWSTLPVKAIVAALTEHGIPAAVSQTAGTFVCNHVFYGLMHALAQMERPVPRGGFIHVPWLPSQATKGQPSLSLAKMTEAIAIAIEVSLTRRRDVRTVGGATE